MSNKKVIVIGSGFAGLSAATTLAAYGCEVTVLEKNDDLGGRARQLKDAGFTFDMGPSWYWMPDVFEHYFGFFGKRPEDYYSLIRLDPSYRVVFGKDDHIDVPANMQEFKDLLESMEKGAGKQLEKFLTQAAYKYQKGINELVYKPGRSITEFLSFRLMLDMTRMDIFQSIYTHLRKYFKHEKILQLMEFPVLFLGAVPQNTPALYSLMNYADIKLGTWYPMGGMYKVVAGMVALAKEKGVRFVTGQTVEGIITDKGKAIGVKTQNNSYEADAVVGGADYHHLEQDVLTDRDRNYSEAYWEKRIMAPSSLLFYLGIDKKLDNLRHHVLFFDRDFGPHAKEIYERPVWPADPLFYVSAASITDPEVAPEGKENLVILIPVAPGLEDTDEIRERYFNIVINRLEALTDQEIRTHIIFKKSFAHRDFIADYNSYKGNAYGLANTLWQTAILKPSLKSKKLSNFFYTGQLTVPGPGVPPSLISGMVVANEVVKDMKWSKPRNIKPIT